MAEVSITGRWLAFFFILFAVQICAQTNATQVHKLLRSEAKKFGLHDRDVAEYRITDSYLSETTGVTHVYLQQQLGGVDVYNAIFGIHHIGDKVIKSTNRFLNIPDGASVPQVIPVNPDLALQSAAKHLGANIVKVEAKTTHLNAKGHLVKAVFGKAGVSRENITTSLYWDRIEDGSLKLMWQVAIYEIDSDKYWMISIDAETGKFLKQRDMVLHCEFHVDHSEPFQQCDHGVSYDAGKEFSSNSYRVFSAPIESPNHGARSLVSAPWNMAGPDNAATSLEWHNDGTTTYTTTRGNNVYAYEDRNNDNLPGNSPTSATLNFDFPFDPAADPVDFEHAAITNLFYWNNITHDILYQYGFDEPSGNFQRDNLNRGGHGNDYVLAEAQDGSGTNNANFYTPADGTNPRMQMFLWSPTTDSSPVFVNTPAELAGELFAIESAFSSANKLNDIGQVTGDLVLVQDETGDSHEACSANPPTNGASISGKIVLIDRGSCAFVEKVKNVQDLGAIGAIVVNNLSGDPFAMGGADNSITIPAVMIYQSDGNVLRQKMDNGVVNVTLGPVPGTTPDSDFDNGIIVHEYGHGVSNRLTGGPSIASCLNNAEQMGEGWSDFLALMLTTDWQTATSTDSRGIGTYVLGVAPDGTGIRTYPYSTSMEVNPFTYTDVATGLSSSPHYVGSVWATMLWEMTWNIIEQEGVDPDMYHGVGGNNISLQLVIEGMKLQPCNPGFVDGRDAILLADELLYQGRHSCAIWQAFAKRGLGVDAKQNDPNNATDGVADFGVPGGVRLLRDQTPDIVSEGGISTIELSAVCACETVNDIAIVQRIPEEKGKLMSSTGTISGDSTSGHFAALAPGDTLAIEFTVETMPCQPNYQLLMDDNVEGAALFTSSQLAGNDTKEWMISNSEYRSGSKSWYAEDFPSLGDVALTSNALTDVSGIIGVSFYHRFQTEGNYDGGVVEYSLDNGTSWMDAGKQFVQNGYLRPITSVYTDSPIAGRRAFTGFSNEAFNTSEFVESILEFHVPDTSTFRIRFRFVTDGSVSSSGLNGWYIDDVVIEQKSGMAFEAQLYVGESVVDSLCYGVEIESFSGQKIFVDGSVNTVGSGEDWPSAMVSLQKAMQIGGCREADTVLLAQGLYLTTPDQDPDMSFIMSDRLVLIGGFPPGGGSDQERDPNLYVSELSGDIGVTNDPTDNAFEVVKVPAGTKGAVIDGVLITKANSSNASGPITVEGELTLRQTVIED